MAYANFALSAELLVGIEVVRSNAGMGSASSGSTWRSGLCLRRPLLLPRNPGDPIQRTLFQQRLGHFHQCDFPLPAHHNIDKRLAQRFVGQQSRMPAAKNNRQPRKFALDRGRYFDRARIMGPVSTEMPRQSASTLSRIDVRPIIRINGRIDHHHLKVGLSQS